MLSYKKPAGLQVLSASQRQISEMSLVNKQNLEDNNLPSNICCRIYDCDLDINPSTLSEWEYYHAHTPHVLVSTKYSQTTIYNKNGSR